MNALAPPVALVGLMGAGKSVVAERLAPVLGGRAFDLDLELERRAGMSVAELFERQGEAEFRRREAALFDEALASGAMVIACGGGAVLDPRSRARLRDECRTVWLDVSPAEAARRIGDGAATRPLLSGRPPAEALAAVLAQRAELYGEVAWLRVETHGKTPDEVALAIEHALELWRA